MKGSILFDAAHNLEINFTEDEKNITNLADGEVYPVGGGGDDNWEYYNITLKVIEDETNQSSFRVYIINTDTNAITGCVILEENQLILPNIDNLPVTAGNDMIIKAANYKTFNGDVLVICNKMPTTTGDVIITEDEGIYIVTVNSDCVISVLGDPR